MINRFPDRNERLVYRMYWCENGEDNFKDFKKEDTLNTALHKLMANTDAEVIEVYEIRGKLACRLEAGEDDG